MPKHEPTCERCKRRIRKGKRFCRTCAVEVAKEFGLDEFLPKEDDDEPAIVEYRNRKQNDTYLAIGIMLLVFAIALWALVGGV